MLTIKKHTLFLSLCLLITLVQSCKSTNNESATANIKLDYDKERIKAAQDKINLIKKSETTLTKKIADLGNQSSAFNAEAPIPPQCYTKTAGQFNPCYVCHQNPVSGRENTMSDGSLQIAYAFSDVGMTNHWLNLFEDRTEKVNNITDEEIMAWVDQDNYSALAPKLKNEEFKGWIPDLDNLELGAEAFDQEGFALDDSQWIAFNYKPFPSTFWPTNGSTDDVMIRLPEAFRNNTSNEYSRDVYKTNLAILEANIKGLNKISVSNINEKLIGKDLNKDGKLGKVNLITDLSNYVGAAKDKFKEPYMYPEGTEFLHTVRYLGFDENNEITYSKRMKEVRYMKKWKDYFRKTYEREYDLENMNKELGRLPNYHLIGDWGLDNGFGWSISGFIEGGNGELRELSYEENLFCMGCHTSIGSTIDKTFSFARKVDGASGWGYIDLKKQHDAPTIGNERGEIEVYLERVGGGGEFRSNPEMFNRWFNSDNTVNYSALRSAKNLYDIIVPSNERAIELNKAYKVIVDDQDFIFGRDATVTSPINVYEHIDNKTAPTLPTELFFEWDIRLDWAKINK